MNTKSPTLSRALTPLIALVFAALIPAAAASAATPEDLADRCINRITHVAQRSINAIHAAGAKGTHKIERLDENDKPVPIMVRTANKANIGVEKHEIKGDRKVNKTADKCLRILTNIDDADPALAALINGARAEAIEAIHTASVNTHIAVNDALEAALEDEEAPDDGAEN